MSTALTLASCDQDGRIRLGAVWNDLAGGSDRLWPVAAQPGLVVLSRSPELAAGAALSVRIAASRLHLGSHLARRVGPGGRVVVRITGEFCFLLAPDLIATLVDEFVAQHNRQHGWW